MNKIEILISSNDNETKEDVLSFLQKELSDFIGITDSNLSKKVSNFYIYEDKYKKKEINDNFYKKIKELDRLAIIKDDFSIKRAQKILYEVSKVEILFRKLVIFVSGSIFGFFESLSEKIEKAKDGKMTRKSSLDSEVDKLSLGQLIEFIKSDLPWTRKEFATMVSESDNFEDFKDRAEKVSNWEKMWDVINEIILEKQVKLSKISEELNPLQNYRNKAAHFKTITKGDLNNTKKHVKSIISAISIKQKLTKEDINSLNKFQNIYSGHFKKIMEINQQYMKIIEAVQPDLNNVQAALDNLQPTIKAIERINERYNNFEVNNEDDQS